MEVNSPCRSQLPTERTEGRGKEAKDKPPVQNEKGLRVAVRWILESQLHRQRTEVAVRKPRGTINNKWTRDGTSVQTVPGRLQVIMDGRDKDVRFLDLKQGT